MEQLSTASGPERALVRYNKTMPAGGRYPGKKKDPIRGRVAQSPSEVVTVKPRLKAEQEAPEGSKARTLVPGGRRGQAARQGLVRKLPSPAYQPRSERWGRRAAHHKGCDTGARRLWRHSRPLTPPVHALEVGFGDPTHTNQSVT